MKSRLFRLPVLASLLAAALMTVALVACTSDPTPSSPAPDFHLARPDSYSSRPHVRPVCAGRVGRQPPDRRLGPQFLRRPRLPRLAAPRTNISAEFSPDGSISGGSGCNHYQGSYTATGNSISLGAMAFTEIGCTEPEGILEQEERFLLMLGDSATFEVDADALTLTTASGETLLFVYREEITPNNGDSSNADDSVSNANDASDGGDSLVGSWKLDSFGDPAYPDSPLPGTEITASFSADGSVSGNAGCNGFQGSYQSGDGALSFGLMAITQMACPEPEGVLEQETRFFNMLNQADEYRMSGGNLILTTPSGEQLLFSPSAP